jgi:CheY-like chemotaxis protein
MRILVVEDHGDSRLVLSNLLGHWGYEVTTVGTVHDALQSLGGASFDVLLADLGLPDGDGLELAAEAKKRQPHTKIVALTGRESEADRRQGMAAGFDHYLTKPIDFQELRGVLGQPV